MAHLRRKKQKKVLEYIEPTGIVVKNGKYELVKGVYLCTPVLNKGFVSEKTRYLEVNSENNLTPGNWITDNPSENWYDYKNLIRYSNSLHYLN